MNKYQEAYKRLINRQYFYSNVGKVYEDLELLGKLVDKETAKTLDYEADGYDNEGKLIYDIALCPKCGKEFEYEINDWGSNYCSDCGQRLDWRIEEDE